MLLLKAMDVMQNKLTDQISYSDDNSYDSCSEEMCSDKPINLKQFRLCINANSNSNNINKSDRGCLRAESKVLKMCGVSNNNTTSKQFTIENILGLEDRNNNSDKKDHDCDDDYEEVDDVDDEVDDRDVSINNKHCLEDKYYQKHGRMSPADMRQSCEYNN